MPIVRDGNCLYESIRQGMNGTAGAPTSVNQMRQEVYDWATRNMQVVRERFVPVESVYVNLEDYVQRQLEDGHPGDELTIFILVNIYNVQVKLLVHDARSDVGVLKQYLHKPSHSSESQRPVEICMVMQRKPNDAIGHYDLVRLSVSPS